MQRINYRGWKERKRADAIAQSSLTPEEREIRFVHYIEARIAGASEAEAAWSASTTVAAIRRWAAQDQRFADAIEVALEDGRNVYADEARARDCDRQRLDCEEE